MIIPMTAAFLALAVPRAQDPGYEPPLIYFLEVDGRKIPVELHKPVALGEKAATLRIEPHRVFAYGDVQFLFPQHMKFETPRFEEMWKVVGTAAAITIKRFPDETDHEKRLQVEMSHTLAGYPEAKERDSTLAVDKRVLKGRSLSFESRAKTRTRSFHSCAVGKGVLVVTLDDTLVDGAPSGEFSAALLLLTMSFRFLDAGSHVTSNREPPPWSAFLESGGTKIPLDLDKAVDFASTPVTLRVEPHRVFDLGGVRFHYPRAMTFKSTDHGWTLDGRAADVTVDRDKSEKDPEAMRGRSLKIWTDILDNGTIVKAPRLPLDKRVLEGDQLNHEGVFGKRLIKRLYSFASGEGAVVLALDDELEKDGGPSVEFRAIVKMLEDSFRISPPKEK